MEVATAVSPTTAVPRASPGVWRLRWLTPGVCRVIFVGLLLFGLVSHVRYLTHDCPIDLSGDEAHYWDWSRQLDWSYYSKGPLVAYIIRASCWAFGQDSMPAVRFPAVVLAAGTSILTYLLTRKLFGSDRLALGTVLLYHVVPMFVAGSMLMTIDPPFFFCWALATYLLAHAALDGRRWAWPVIGVVVGVGFLAKYSMLLWFVPMLLFLATDREARRLLRSPGPWVAMGLSLLFLTPVVVWNARHGWVSFHHVATQTGTSSDGKFRITNVLEFLGGQFGVVGPGIFVIMTAGVLYAARPFERTKRQAVRDRAHEDLPPREGTLEYERVSPDEPSAWAAFTDRLASAGRAIRGFLVRISPGATRPEPHVREMRFLAWFGVVFFGLTFLSSFRTKVQLNWPAPAYFTLMILAAYFLATRMRDARTWRGWRWWLWPTVAFGLLMMPIAHDVEVLFPAVRWVNAHANEWRKQKDNRLLAWLGKRVPKDGIDARKVDFTAKLKGWSELGDALSEEMKALGPGAFVLCEDYQQTAEAAFYMKGQPKTFYMGSYFRDDPKRQTQYDLWPDRTLEPPDGPIGRNSIYVGHTDQPTRDLREAFERVEGVTVIKDRVIDGKYVVRPEVRSIELNIVRDGVPVRTFRYFRCYGFKGLRRTAKTF
jgi:4-amino-4-deoxy-L-arabinose transferase-like glycosyltransferase